MDNKHTKGPWTLQDYGWKRRTDHGRPVFQGAIVDQDGVRIHSGAAFGIFGATEEEAEANAMLIAAAPELLKALERIARPMDCGCKPCHGDCTSREGLQIHIEGIQEIALAAIAKAKAVQS